MTSILLRAMAMISILVALAECLDVEARQTSGVQDLINSSSLENSMVSMAWYTGWHSRDFPLENVSWSKYTQMTYAFALTTPDPASIWLEESDKAILPQFVTAAHEHNVKANLALGGWTGSRWFSTNVGSPENRTAFVKSITNLAASYKLDGVNFDWEYPNRQGVGCNIISPNDTPNFLSFLQELRRSHLGANLTLSAATDLKPFNDTNGIPSTDVSDFSKVLDFIIVMNYDVKSSSIGVGSSSPLNDSCAPLQYRHGSATSEIEDWAKAGIPRNQIVLGVPAYGHSFSVPTSSALEQGPAMNLAAFPAFDRNNTPLGDKWDGPGGADICGVQQGPTGVYNYWGLVAAGFLNSDGSVRDGISYRFDECSQTPFVYDRKTQIMVSFDNQRSFAAKGDYIKSKGLGGFAMWEAGGDLNNLLLDSILNATINGDPTQTHNKTSPSALTPSSLGTTITVRRLLLVGVAPLLMFSMVANLL